MVFLAFKFISNAFTSLGIKNKNMDQIQPSSASSESLQVPSIGQEKKAPKKKSKKALTLKQKLWIKHYFKDKNASKAARLAGYKAHSGVVGTQNIQKLSKNELFLAELAKSGLTDESLLAPINGALSATVYTTAFGEVLSSDEPDHHTRLKAAEMGLKLLGRMGKDDENTGNAITLQILNYSPDKVAPTIIRNQNIGSNAI